MGIHVNIGEAKTRLSELIAAAERGEDVVIARAGKPAIRFTLISPEDQKAGRRAERLSWIGSFKGLMPADAGDLFLKPEYTDEELDEFEHAVTNPRT